MRGTGSIVIAIAVALLLALNTFFIVPQTHQAVVLHLRAPLDGDAGSIKVGNELEAGLHVKIPFIQEVRRFDKRNIGVSLENTRIVASDQKQLEVDAYARYRIVDPLRFLQSVATEERGNEQLRSILQPALRDVLGTAPAQDIIFRRRAQLMAQIAQNMNNQARKIGVEIIDVRIRQADLPQEIRERVYVQMSTELEQLAAGVRARGTEQATTIRAEAEREKTVILATAQEQSERIRGEGDAQRTRIFAQAYGQDAEFAAFYRSMRAYETALPEGTTMIVPPEGEFFRYLRNQDGR